MAASTRPLAVIEAEERLTLLAIEVCGSLVTAALAGRRRLLSDGWPATHPMCVDLDAVAERWAAQVTHQRRALGALADERKREAD